MTKTFSFITLAAALLLLPSASSHALCLWTIDATFSGDATGSATVFIQCKDRTGMISVTSNHGSYHNIPIDASGDEKSVIMSGTGSYGYLSYSGVANGTMKNGRYRGSWKVTLTGSDGRRRTFSGKWQGTGNYIDICKLEECK
jgi:hypothetical protein